MSRHGGALSALILVSACAGSSFELAEEQAAGQGGSAFPPLSTTGNQGGDGNLAGASGSGGASGGAAGDAGNAGNAGSAGAAGAGGAPPAPVTSACGELRPGGLDDAEVCIPAGTFTMGSAADRVPTGYSAHGPEHEVTLADYVLDTYEVTVARYRACVTAGACDEPSTTAAQGCTYTATAGANERFPVTCVRWGDADNFCAWDGGRRLPTEAEWERAARGTTGTTYAWGNDAACNKGVFGGSTNCTEHAGTLPKAVGSEPRGASAEGAMDLTGNAWEWVNDWFGAYAAGAADNPVGPVNGSVRVQRGGNWLTPPADAAAYMRRPENPGATGPFSFRCARAAAP